MKIFVLDFCKKRMSTTIVSILLVSTILIACSIGVVTQLFQDELYLESADAIPYDKIIILDAGHGGEDPGAIGVTGVYEKDLNLQLVQEIGKALEEKGYIVVYTRTNDRLLYNEDQNIKGIRKISDLKNRCQAANKYPDSILVSIHMNSFGDGRYSGLQVYYSPGDNNSRLLADKIQSSVKESLQKDNNRVIKQGDGMYLLENTEPTAVLIECGFLTNKTECEKLSQKEYQKELSFSIVCGIIEYVEEKTK
jgi:N-acetylmuramoyl-L-alanine amidase